MKYDEIRYSGDSSVDWDNLEIQEVYQDAVIGYARLQEAYQMHNSSYLQWLLENHADAFEPSWFEPRDYNGDRSHFELLSNSQDPPKEKWNLDAINQATSAIFEKPTEASWNHTNATINALEDDLSNPWNTYGIIYKPPPAINSDMVDEIKSRTEVRLPRGTMVDYLGAFAYGGLVLRTSTTVAQLSHLASTIEVYYDGGEREQYPDALIIQAYRNAE